MSYPIYYPGQVSLETLMNIFQNLDKICQTNSQEEESLPAVCLRSKILTSHNLRLWNISSAEGG